MSREIDANPDDPFSYYNIPKDESADPYIGQFLTDLRSLDSKWVIFITAAVDENPKCHFIYGAKKGDTGFDDPNITVKDIDSFKEVSSRLAEAFAPYGVESLWSDRAGNSSMYIGRHVGDSNAFTMRLSYKTLLWHRQKMNMALEAAKVIISVFTPGKEFREMESWKVGDKGFEE